MRKHLRFGLMLGFALVLAMPIFVSGPAQAASSHLNERQWVNPQIVRLNGDVSCPYPYWSGSPDNTTKYTNTASNDGDSSYVQYTGGGAGTGIGYFNIGDISDNASLENETYSLTIWVVSKASGVPPPTMTLWFGLADSYASYWVSSRIIDKQSSSSAYVNRSINVGFCPWTGANWTVTTINNALFVMYCNPGTYRITEVGIIVWTIIPYESPNTSSEIGLGDMIFIAMIAATVGVLMWLGIR